MIHTRHILAAMLWMLALAVAVGQQTDGRGLSHADESRFDSLYFRALAMNQTGHNDAAFDLLHQALAIDTASGPVLYALSACYSERREPQVALSMAERAVASDTANFWYNSMLAAMLKGVSHYADAARVYERLSRLYPKRTSPLYELAQVYLAIDSLDDCLRVLDRIEERMGPTSQLAEFRFAILRRQGRIDEAFESYDRLIERSPYNIDYRIRKGEMQMQTGQLDEARRTYDQAAAIEPDNAYLWLAMSDYHSVMGHQDAADSLIEAALVNDKLDVDTKVELLTNYLKTLLRRVVEERREADDTSAVDLPRVDTLFATIIGMHPTEAEVYALYADYLAAIDNPTSACRQMRYAVDLQPTEIDYWTKYLTVASSAADTILLLSLCDEAQAACPEAMEPHYFRAAVHMQRTSAADYRLAIAEFREARRKVGTDQANMISTLMGNVGDAFHLLAVSQHGTTAARAAMDSVYAAYDEAMAYNPNNYMVLNNYAYFLSLEKRDLNRAETMAARVVKQYPESDIYLDTYAWIYFQQGNYLLAKFYQEQALDKAGESPSADLLEHYGDILAQSGDTDRAVALWQRALATDGCEHRDVIERKIAERRYIETQPEWR